MIPLRKFLEGVSALLIHTIRQLVTLTIKTVQHYWR
nr:MAG TPA: hypothetical protein [Caudoviricetes sp.]